MVYHLPTHQLILTVGEGGYRQFIWSENIFQKFLDKLMVRKNGLEVEIFFSRKFHRPPESQLVFPLFPRAKE